VSSLRTRLFVAIALIVVLCVGLTVAIGLVLTRRAVDKATLLDVRHQAALIAQRERVAVAAFTYLKSEQIQRLLEEQHERYQVGATNLPQEAQLLLREHNPAYGTVAIDGNDYFFAAEPDVHEKTLVLLRDKSVTASQWTPFAFALLVAALAGGVLAGLAALLLARRIALPVRRVAEASRKLARGTHPDPVPVEGAAELATLARAFNDLAQQLARARAAERNFLLSVSHELKTPLTAIRGYAEAIQDGALDPSEAAATVAQEAARLERLVRDLLDLARMNRTDFSVQNSEIDLGEVAEDAVRRYEQVALAFGVTIEAVTNGSAPAIADSDRVLQVVSNLVENALRLGGDVRVVAEPGKLRVEDNGPGLQPDELEHAFERFYLHERYGRERPVGTGLGLAIVKELTAAMGGSVEVESEPGRLTRFTVRFAVPARVVSRA
jgi:two-component system sensor histidine kinase BaeS